MKELEKILMLWNQCGRKVQCDFMIVVSSGIKCSLGPVCCAV